MMNWGDIGSWESLKLFAFWCEVASVVGVILGVWYERDNFPKVVQDTGWVILVISLAFELFFIMSLSGIEGTISRLQQSKIIALETKIAPRNLDAAQRIHAREALKQFRGTPYDLTLLPLKHDPFPTFVEDGSQLPDELILILSNWCGWKLQSVEGSVKKVPLPRESAAYPLFFRNAAPDILVGEMTGISGVKIVLPPEGRLQDAAKALLSELNQADIPAWWEFPPPNNNIPADALTDEATVHIIIGTK